MTTDTFEELLDEIRRRLVCVGVKIAGREPRFEIEGRRPELLARLDALTREREAREATEEKGDVAVQERERDE